eukprot:TRINITY_DN15896_c0_g1_i1.p1 TRINITY_DN15896_c0_g1~~TRINITY_DN15896_c0_g1_i1.p1  ORF type:complete len:244 (-),score=37.48 TRINITY_DN15896_c0_g1_i1:24-755(-)
MFPAISVTKQTKIERIAHGLVILKGILNEEQQKWLANYALTASSTDTKGGFWSVLPDGKTVLNNDKGRGRIYDAITEFPEPTQIEALCQSLVKLSREVDDRMPEMKPTHLLLLYYATEEGMYWHKDSDPNDGDNDHPIVSIAIGNSCSFGYKLLGKGEQFVQLDSGDVIIWGGPNRMLLHCVDKVHPNSCPSYLPINNVRLNFTFRDAPNVLGRENKYKSSVEVTYNQLLPHVLEKANKIESQ